MTPEQTKALKVLQNIHLDTALTGTVKLYVQEAGTAQAPMQDDLNGIIAFVCKRLADDNYPPRVILSCPTCHQETPH